MTGFGEIAWPAMCRDFCAGALKPRYDGGSPDIAGLPWPCRDLQRRFGYAMPNTVFATRGCRNNCDFCAVVGAKFGWHVRPVAEVAAEVAALRGPRFVFNDVSLCEDKAFTTFRSKRWTPKAASRSRGRPSAWRDWSLAVSTAWC